MERGINPAHMVYPIKKLTPLSPYPSCISCKSCQKLTPPSPYPSCTSCKSCQKILHDGQEHLCTYHRFLNPTRFWVENSMKPRPTSESLSKPQPPLSNESEAHRTPQANDSVQKEYFRQQLVPGKRTKLFFPKHR